MANREKYLDQIGKLFIANGVRKLTMDDVADRIGITRKTLYNNFHDKQNLVNAVLEHCMVYNQQIRTEIESGGENAISILIETFDVFVTQNRLNIMVTSPVFVSSMLELEVYPELLQCHQSKLLEYEFQFMHNNLLRGVKEGLYRQDMDCQVIAYFNAYTVENTLKVWHRNPTLFNINHVLSEVVKYHIRGQSTPKGIEILEKELARFNR